MKSLTKLRLINWHYFSNVTTDIKNITFLTGPNGTGKSTIIDALQIIILGSTRPENFNKAANEKGRSGRSLLSYLRGQTGIKDDGSNIVLRRGTFSSYIAIEIFDDEENRTFTLGVVFDVDSSDKIDKHYFYLDSPFPENGFSNSDSERDKSKIRPRRYRELSFFARNNYKVNHFRFFDTDTDYQSFSKEAFGNLPDKYFSLFKKAVSFAPISNISSFITEYICDADENVDIAPMQKNIEQYKILEAEAKTLKEKVSVLTEIQKIFQDLQESRKKIDRLNYINARADFERGKKSLDNLNEQVKKGNDRLLAINNELNTLDNQLDDLSHDLNSYNAKKLQSDNYSLTEKLSRKKEQVRQEITRITLQVKNVKDTLISYASSYERACSSFASYYRDFDTSRFGDKLKERFDSFLELVGDLSLEAKSVKDGLTGDRLDFDVIKNFRNDRESLRNEASGIKSLINNKLYMVSQDLQSLQSDLSAVSQGKKPFDQLGPRYRTVKRGLESALKARHRDAYVHIFCDLIDINDPEWTFALEAVLYRQKFNFFVNPEYYEEANRIRKQLTSSYNYYSVSLVDTERLLKAGRMANEDSIAYLVDTKDEGARAYTDYLLGRIKKCSSFEEARASGSGLLSDGTGYRGFATWYLNKAYGRVFFIGTKVSSKTKAVSSADYQKRNNLYSLLNEANNKISDLLTLPLMSLNELQADEADLVRLNQIPSLQEKVDSIGKERVSASKGDRSLVNGKIEEIEAQRSKIKSQQSTLLTESGEIRANRKRLNGQDIPLAEANLASLKQQLESFPKDIVNEEYEPFFAKLLDQQGRSVSQVKSMAYKESITAQSNQITNRNRLWKLRNDYCSTYNLNYDAQSETSNAEFDRELENISKVRLPDYEAKITKAHDESVKEFKDDFIYKLRTAIDTVYAQIDELNQALLDSRFGRDTYQFKVSPNKDFIEYYNRIRDEDLLRAGDAETHFNEKYRSTRNDLFNLISSSTSASGEQKEQILRNVERFTSYTTYIIFDLLKTSGTGEEQQTISLQRSFSSQSGGESQTPFYIAILASFAQLCRVKNASDNNTLRLVIFDEAFSKRDAARIRKSTELLRNFGLQAILSTPSEKLRDLVNYVDLILVTIHEDKRKRSYLDVYQEKDKASPVKRIPSPLIKEEDVGEEKEKKEE